MSENNHGDSEHDDEHHPHLHAFAIPLGAAIEAVDRNEQRAEIWSIRIANFLDGLTVDQALVLRRMLNMDTACAWNMYFDGQLASILRLVHHVNPENGDPDFPTVPPAAGDTPHVP